MFSVKLTFITASALYSVCYTSIDPQLWSLVVPSHVHIRVKRRDVAIARYYPYPALCMNKQYVDLP